VSTICLWRLGVGMVAAKEREGVLLGVSAYRLSLVCFICPNGAAMVPIGGQMALHVLLPLIPSGGVGVGGA
jgi:hypothetical protein